MNYGVLIVELWAIAILILTPIAELILHGHKLGLFHLPNSPDLSDLPPLPLEDLGTGEPDSDEVVSEWVIVSTRNLPERDII